MNRFAALLDRLVLTPQRNEKLRLLRNYFDETPDPDRGYALGAITGDLVVASVKPAMLRQLIHERMDDVLFDISYDYIGDLAETISLAWPAKSGANRAPLLSEIVEELRAATRIDGPRLIERRLDELDASGRWALIKLVTRGFRIGVSSRLAKQSLALFGDKEIIEIEELWHSLSPPYETLFAWLEGKGEKPQSALLAPFRPAMLAHPLTDRDLQALAPEDFVAEWKWDGVRVQAVSEGGVRRLYSRTGDDIGSAFPDIIDALDFDASIDGELLVFDPAKNPFVAAPFSDLQKRLNRKTVSRKLMNACPAFIRAYDLLSVDGEDLRALPFLERRRRLEAFFVAHATDRIDLSPIIPYTDKLNLAELRAAPPHHAIEGLMLKRKAAPYLPGRPKGEWWKWKRQPMLIDAVLMYAQRGHGKRSSFYSDYTFGVWSAGALTPVGKAYFGFTDQELKEIDRYVRNNTVERYGPVRQVRTSTTEGLVFEVAFEGLNRSPRHKSGVAMRFPRINRIRWDKRSSDADTLETLQEMLPERDGAQAETATPLLSR